MLAARDRSTPYPFGSDTTGSWVPRRPVTDEAGHGFRTLQHPQRV